MRLIVFLFAWLLTVPASADPEFWRHEWPRTDFSRSSVENWGEILSGGPPRDGIPALSKPDFLPVVAISDISGREPVITLELAEEVPRAYPIRYLIWHEIVNDQLGDLAYAVTFCPLCNSALIFDRRTAQGILTFGVTGKLRNSDMVMYDRETESWWQQAEGRAIVGALTGTRLDALPGWMESLDAFRSRNPDGLVMAESDHARPYGRNPYRGYDTASRPFLYSGEPPPYGIAPLARVVRVGDRAWPLDRLARAGRLTEAEITLSWEQGLASALDTAEIGKGREIGSVRVQDTQGRDLPHDVMFAFAFHALWPQGTWMLGH